MNEKEKEQALEDLKVIRRMMEASSKVVGSNGVFFILFGVYWLVSTILWILIEKLRGIVYGKILIAFWLFWILASMSSIMFYSKSHPQSEMDWSKISPRIKKQSIELFILALILGFTAPILVSKVGPGDIIIFIQSLIMGVFFYCAGIFFAGEFRFCGIFILIGMYVIPFSRNHGMIVFGIAFGIGMILTGIFSRRRWLMQKKEEVVAKT